MWRYQTYITLLIAAAIIAAVAALRPVAQMDSPEAYWARKMLWGAEFDVVIIGDSRMNRGVSPEVMGRKLTGLRIANYSFQSCALTKDYLDTVAGKLDPRAARRIIVIGVDPIALTPNAAKQNKFTEMRAINPVELQQQAHLDQALRRFEPLTATDVDEPVHTRTGNKTKVYHPDGWVAVREIPPEPQRTLPYYREYYKGNTVSGEIVSSLLAAVRAWRAQGIEVYGLRPPVPDEMVQLENQFSGYDEVLLAHAFREAGGVWLEFDHTKYASYDGSHLDANAARKFSDHLATKIRDRQVR